MSELQPAHWLLIEPVPDGIRLCRGDHGSGAECEWEYFVPTAANPGQTHYEGCWRQRGHHACAMSELRRLQQVCAYTARWCEDRAERIEYAAPSEASALRDCAVMLRGQAAARGDEAPPAGGHGA